MKNRIGEKNERLTIIGFSHSGDNWRTYWLCRCDCGNEKIVSGNQFKRTKSCGCLRDEKLVKRVTKHGGTSKGWSNLYRTWAAMKDRCGNRNCRSYRWYGARGIKVCDRWLDFSVFRSDILSSIGDRPHKMTIDRINNDVGYEPNNVRWATRQEQLKNRRLHQ